MPCNMAISKPVDMRPGKTLQLITTLYKLSSNVFMVPWTLTLCSTDILYIELACVFFSRCTMCKFSTMFSNA